MRIGLISDIHANLAALEAVLNALGRLNPDRLYCLGDLVGYGPFPNECVELVRDHCDVAVRGNHDSGVIGETPLRHFNEHGAKAVEWTRSQLAPENLQYLNTLPMTHEEKLMTLVHSSPLKPEKWTYILDWKAAKKCFRAFDTPLCFIGHTHVPAIISEDSPIDELRKGTRYLVNVGSVGQPRDGNPRAAFCFLDTDQWTCEIHRVEYDVDRTAGAIINAGLPGFLANRLSAGI